MKIVDEKIYNAKDDEFKPAEADRVEAERIEADRVALKKAQELCNKYVKIYLHKYVWMDINFNDRNRESVLVKYTDF